MCSSVSHLIAHPDCMRPQLVLWRLAVLRKAAPGGAGLQRGASASSLRSCRR